MRKAIMFAMMLALASPAAAQSPAYRFRHGDNPVADADAYLLTLVAADPRMRAAVAADPDLKALGQRLTASRLFHLPVGNLGDFENWIDGDRDAFQFAGRVQLCYELAQGTVGHAL